MLCMTDTLANSATKSISDQFRMESRPFSLHRETVVLTNASLFKEMKAYRHKYTRMHNKSVSDEYESELTLIAWVLAYVDVASRRFGDMIPMRVEDIFQQRLTEGLRNRILKTVVWGEGCEERCRAFLEESPETQAKRNELKKRKAILAVANEELSQVRIHCRSS
jgi:hypothetical protein